MFHGSMAPFLRQSANLRIPEKQWIPNWVRPLRRLVGKMDNRETDAATMFYPCSRAKIHDLFHCPEMEFKIE